MEVSALDVASYILKKMGPMTTMKLQKLVYYCQAWSLVWDEEPLFHEKIEAWSNGPIVRELFNEHKNMFKISELPGGNPAKISEIQKDTIDQVLEYYGEKPSQWLSDLTHMEEPWKNARKGLAPGDKGFNEITLASMSQYYSSLE